MVQYIHFRILKWPLALCVFHHFQQTPKFLVHVDEQSILWVVQWLLMVVIVGWF